MSPKIISEKDRNTTKQNNGTQYMENIVINLKTTMANISRHLANTFVLL